MGARGAYDPAVEPTDERGQRGEPGGRTGDRGVADGASGDLPGVRRTVDDTDGEPGAEAGRPDLCDADPAGRGPGHAALLAAGLMAPVGLVVLRLATEPAAGGAGTHTQLGLEPCHMRALVGVDCPGCGVTTALSHAAHGAPAMSFATHPFGALLALALLAAPVLALGRHLAGADLAADLGRHGRRLALLALVALLAGWLLRLALGEHP